MQLKTDDGTLLEVKEATVLDANGEVLREAPAPEWRSSSGNAFIGTRVFRVNGWMVPVFVIVVLLTLTLGAVFLSVFLVIAVGLALLKRVFRSLGLLA